MLAPRSGQPKAARAAPALAPALTLARVTRPQRHASRSQVSAHSQLNADCKLSGRQLQLSSTLGVSLARKLAALLSRLVVIK